MLDYIYALIYHNSLQSIDPLSFFFVCSHRSVCASLMSQTVSQYPADDSPAEPLTTR